MASQTVTTTVNYDSAAITPLLDGESITINGGSLTFNADVRWNQQAAVFGPMTVSSTLGGTFAIDGTTIWEIAFSSSTGNVPTQNALGSNGVTGGTSGATGELTRVWASGSFTPATAGGAMPAAGFIKLRTKTGTFQAGETITLPGGATIVAASAGKRSWIHLVGRGGQLLNLPRIANVSIAGDWYSVGSTDGTDNQTLLMPVRDGFPAIQVETSPGSGVYEWWMDGGDSWNGWYINTDSFTSTNVSPTADFAPGPTNYPACDRYRETTAAGTHNVSKALAAADMDAGSYTLFAIVKKETRQWCVVQLSTNGGTDRYGALVDLDAGTIIANPSVGSPTGTSSSITSMGGGWYRVEVTLTHLNNTIMTSNIALSDSATPTYSTGLPTYTGNTAQGLYLGFSAVMQASFAFIPTDEARGKYFYSDPFAGTITFAKRGTNNAGYKPASGCAIRIPNIICGVTTPGDYSAQYILIRTRYQMGIGNCLFTAANVCMSWLINTGMTTFKLSDSTLLMSVTSFQSFNTEIRNCAFGNPWWATGNAFIAANSSNLYLYDCRIVRRVVGSGLIAVSTSSNVNFIRCRFERITAVAGKSNRTGVLSSIISIVVSGGEFTDCTVVHGGSTFNIQNFTIKNLTYCDVMTGTTPALGSTAIDIQGKDNVVDGFSLLSGVSNVHPRDNVVNVSAFFTNLTLKNMGSPSSLISGGSANEMGRILNVASAGKNLEVRRCYFTNIRTTPIGTQFLALDNKFYDVWGIGLAGASGSQQMSTQDGFARGCRWTNTRATGSTAITGTHWDDAYSSDTTGIITILGNEPTAQSAAQCNATFGAGSGFIGTGSAVLSKLTDVINWTTPWKIYGHNFLAGGCALAGADCQNLIFEYKIDTGSGYGGSWAFLANTVRRASGGTSGTNTVTVNTADRTALTRQPQIGDFVQSGTFKLPANTTVQNVSGDVITCSNNFTGNLSTNEFVTFSPVNVAVSAANGYSLQVRTYPTAAAATTLLTAFSIGIQTDATAQQTQHPLPGFLFTMTDLKAGSEVRAYVGTDPLTCTEIAGIESSGTSFTFDHNVGGQAGYIRIISLGYIDIYLPITYQSANQSIPIQQQIDRQYSNP
jgi:hypothetical protein